MRWLPSLIAAAIPAACIILAADPASRSSPLNEREWLESMVWHHGFSIDTIASATGMEKDAVTAALKRYDIAPETRPAREPDAPLLTLPYPGGLHPRLGFLDGAVDPQRGTKLSLFPPWPDGGYFVVDVPEAIWSQRGLLFLAHTHIPTVWGAPLPDVDWERTAMGAWQSVRQLPDGTGIRVEAVPVRDHIDLRLQLENCSDSTLTDLRVQVCVLLGRAKGFEEQSSANKVLDPPFAAARSANGNRWIITGWEPLHRTWENPPCPCIHADPKLPDCPPGETSSARGWISFFQGDDIQAELRRLRKVWKPGATTPQPPR